MQPKQYIYSMSLQFYRCFLASRCFYDFYFPPPLQCSDACNKCNNRMAKQTVIVVAAAAAAIVQAHIPTAPIRRCARVHVLVFTYTAQHKMHAYAYKNT